MDFGDFANRFCILYLNLCKKRGIDKLYNEWYTVIVKVLWNYYVEGKVMKKIYNAPELEVTVLSAEDILDGSKEPGIDMDDVFEK